MNDQNSDNSSDWNACAPGTLTSLSTRLVRNRRRGILVRATLVAVAVLLMFNAGRVFFSGNGIGSGQTKMYAGITCDDVQAKLAQWKKGQLDEATTARIDGHLQLCSSCTAKAKALQAQRERASESAVVAVSRISHYLD